MSQATLTSFRNKSFSGARLFVGLFFLVVLVLFSTSQALAAVWFVTPTGAGVKNGTSWGDAFATIQAAINMAAPGDEIWVKGGTYTLTPGTIENPSEILVDEVVEIYGGFTGGETLREQRDWKTNKTTVSGIDYNTRIFHLIANATIDGLTITGGRISAYTEPPDPAVGGGILVESNNAVIRNCVITDNRASVSGAGIALLGVGDSSSIINTWIYDNFSMYGVGGITSSSGSPRIINCAITNNYGENVGGISAASTPMITNCSIFGNTTEGSSSQASGLHCFGAATISNCIIWGNQDLDGEQAQIFAGAGSTISYSNIEQTGFEGINNNIRFDPHFVAPDGIDNLPGTADDDFRLQPSSPCINAGSSAAVPPGITTDLDGNPRVIGAAADMGAYEYQYQVTYCPDVDGDGYVVESETCTIPAGKQVGDCNDSNAGVNPGATEVPNNGVDENCDGVDPDTIGPDMEMTLPTDGTTALLDTNIVVHVKDGSSGVAVGSIVMKVEGVTVTPNSITGTASDYTVTYDPPSPFTNGQEVNIIVTASDMALPVANTRTESFSFTALSSTQLDPVGDEDQDGIPNGVEQTLLKTDPLKKTLFVRPYKKETPGAPLVYWTEFSATLFPDPRGTGFAKIDPFYNLDIEISVIGDPNHPYEQMRNINYDPATDTNDPNPACDILELIYNATNSEDPAELPTVSANAGHTYFDGGTWTWDTKGDTPNILLDPYYQKYKYHKAKAYALPLDRYIGEGAYAEVDVGQEYIESSGCGDFHNYCYEWNHCSPMNLNDTESGPPYVLGPDLTVEMTGVVYDTSNGLKAKITAIDPRAQGYDRNAVLKRTIVHEMGHAILNASNADHCIEPLCIMYQNTVGGWGLLNFGGPACTHGLNTGVKSIRARIHNAFHP
jgi:hypothetical protein